MKKVYIVTEGNYSDYDIVAVFSTKKKAKEFLKKYEEVYPYIDVRIEEYPVDVPVEKCFGYVVVMKKNGDVVRTEKTYDTEFGFRGFHFLSGDLVWAVNTDDEKKAIKVVNEKRAIILAHNAWGDEERVRQIFKRK